MGQKINIFKYIDYRQFLADMLKAKKEVNPHFSFRFIAQRLGLSSPGFFNWVIQGKRDLSEPLAHKVAGLFELNKKPLEYFLTLVRYNQSKSVAGKQELFEKISIMRRRHVDKVNPRQYQLYENWYNNVIRELVEMLPFKGDYAKLAASTIPRVTAKQAQDSVLLLEKLGLIQKEPDGSYRRSHSTLTTGDEWHSATISNMQVKLLEMGIEALAKIPRAERDISHLMISVSDKSMKKISGKIKELRRLILDLAENDNAANRVYVCNFQVFPVSQPSGGDK
jgi:uncharacterized protein (TIGR02147 family)